jgi:hypothetical protein
MGWGHEFMIHETNVFGKPHGAGEVMHFLKRQARKVEMQKYWIVHHSYNMHCLCN